MNQELKRLYDEDRLDRMSNISEDLISKKDSERLVAVDQILKESATLEAIDYHHAALIYQHGETVSDYQKANELALKATNLGDESARPLYAKTLDRLLISQGKPQKYGTQFKMDDGGHYKLALPVDPTVTDEERAKWNVPSLKDAQVEFDKRYK